MVFHARFLYKKIHHSIANNNENLNVAAINESYQYKIQHKINVVFRYQLASSYVTERSNDFQVCHKEYLFYGEGDDYITDGLVSRYFVVAFDKGDSFQMV